MRKPLTPEQFKRKVELALHKINQAMNSAVTAFSDLQLLAEDQMGMLDDEALNSKSPTKRTRKQYNVASNTASDVNDWATESYEKLDEIGDTTFLRVLLRKSVK